MSNDSQGQSGEDWSHRLLGRAAAPDDCVICSLPSFKCHLLRVAFPDPPPPASSCQLLSPQPFPFCLLSCELLSPTPFRAMCHSCVCFSLGPLPPTRRKTRRHL